MGQARQGFSTHPHGKSGDTGGGGGLSAHQAHRSTQTGDGRLPSLQTKDLVHTGSAGLSCLSVEHRLPTDQRDDSGLRTHTAHLYHRPAESAERGVLLPYTANTLFAERRQKGEARQDSSLDLQNTSRGAGGSTAGLLQRLHAPARSFYSSHLLPSFPPVPHPAPRCTPTTSNTIPLSADNRLISE